MKIDPDNRRGEKARSATTFDEAEYHRWASSLRNARSARAADDRASR
jgi:hypothetical protein